MRACDVCACISGLVSLCSYVMVTCLGCALPLAQWMQRLGTHTAHKPARKSEHSICQPETVYSNLNGFVNLWQSKIYEHRCPIQSFSIQGLRLFGITTDTISRICKAGNNISQNACFCSGSKMRFYQWLTQGTQLYMHTTPFRFVLSFIGLFVFFIWK